MIMIKHHSGFIGFFLHLTRIILSLYLSIQFEIAFFPHCMTCLSYIIKKLKKNRQIAMVLCNLAGNCCDLTNFFDLKKIILPRFSEAYGV